MYCFSYRRVVKRTRHMGFQRVTCEVYVTQHGWSDTVVGTDTTVIAVAKFKSRLLYVLPLCRKRLTLPFLSDVGAGDRDGSIKVRTGVHRVCVYVEYGDGLKR